LRRRAGLAPRSYLPLQVEEANGGINALRRRPLHLGVNRATAYRGTRPNFTRLRTMFEAMRARKPYIATFCSAFPRCFMEAT